jgi:hypothetical protein
MIIGTGGDNGNCLRNNLIYSGISAAPKTTGDIDLLAGHCETLQRTDAG